MSKGHEPIGGRKQGRCGRPAQPKRLIDRGGPNIEAVSGAQSGGCKRPPESQLAGVFTEASATLFVAHRREQDGHVIVDRRRVPRIPLRIPVVQMVLDDLSTPAAGRAGPHLCGKPTRWLRPGQLDSGGS